MRMTLIVIRNRAIPTEKHNKSKLTKISYENFKKNLAGYGYTLSEEYCAIL